MIVVGDVAGQYFTLLKLLEQFPQGHKVVSIGDMVDRGQDSALVVEWFKQHGDAILGNHDHMMLDYYHKNNYYMPGIWFENGGGPTVTSYATLSSGKELLEQHLRWLDSRPLYIDTGDFFISHATKNPTFTLEQCCDLGDGFKYGRWSPREECTLIWNRGSPRRMPGKIQIYGHNSYRQVEYHKDSEGVFAIGIDTSRANILTAIELPSLTIYQQEYI